MSGRSKRTLSEQGPAEIAGDRTGQLGEVTSNFPKRHRRSLPPASAETREDRLQRAAIVGQLAGGVLHDFNNVLTVIAGVIGLVTEAVTHEPQLAAMTKLIDDAVARGVALCAHGYGDVAEHPEQIFTDVVMAADFIRKSGGSLKSCAASGDFARVEILLPKMTAAARWLADD